MTPIKLMFTFAIVLALAGLGQAPAQAETVIVQPGSSVQTQAGDTVIVPGNPVPAQGGTVIGTGNRVVILKPGDPAMSDGCWAEIFEDDDFDQSDPHIIIKGPFDAASLKDLAGRNWNNDIESLIMGPRATMYAYEEKDFKSTEIVFAPNQRVKDLSEVKMGNDIESFRLKCN